MIDKKYCKRVLLDLINNANEALSEIEKGKISIKSKVDKGATVLVSFFE